MADRVGIIIAATTWSTRRCDDGAARPNRSAYHAARLAALPPEIARFPVELEPGEALYAAATEGKGKAKWLR